MRVEGLEMMGRRDGEDAFLKWAAAAEQAEEERGERGLLSG